MISGGVDSAVAVHRICEMGYKPDLFYIKRGMEGEGLSCTAEEDIELSTATARCYGLHLEVVDLQKQYWELVVGYAMERATSLSNSDALNRRWDTGTTKSPRDIMPRYASGTVRYGWVRHATP